MSLCRRKAEQEVKKKGSAKLSGDGFEISKCKKRYLKLSKNFLDQAVFLLDISI